MSASAPLAPSSVAAQTSFSPDSSMQLDQLISEWSPSLWTHAPRVTDVATGRVLFDLWGTSWDAQAAWVGENGLRLDLRRYDAPGWFTLVLDLQGRTFQVVGEEKRPLADVRCGMDEAFELAHRRYLESLASPFRPPAPAAPGRGATDPPPPGRDRTNSLLAALRRLLGGRS